jgi:gluconate 2-dehydrogenase subunit 3-like protein
VTQRIDLRQDRRMWLKTTAAALGATVLPIPGVANADVTRASEPTQSDSAKSPAAAHPASPAKFFTPEQRAMIEDLSETIIPADSRSGGAKAANVADYIEQTIRESVDDTQKTLWREGLRLLESMSQHYNGKSLVSASPEERFAILKVLSDNSQLTDLPEVQFFQALKHLTIRGYYTSKIGIHDELEYKGNRILMEFVGCGDPTPPSSSS